MLRLSQDQQNPQSIQFDESNWQLHLSSLKPLGLNVLLNLCNPGVTTTLSRFSDHLRHIALQESHSAVLPGHIPWGLCDFSRLIGTTLSIYIFSPPWTPCPSVDTFIVNQLSPSHLGFTPGAKDLFKLQNHIALYHLPSEEPVKEPLLSKLPSGGKRKPPLSHMISLFVRDVCTSMYLSHSSHTSPVPYFYLTLGCKIPAWHLNVFFLSLSDTEQMLSHGTADIILEACTDFWDGADIYPLSGSDRYGT